MTTTESLHLSVRVGRSAADVYAFASDPRNLPRWAHGLGSDVVERDGGWWVETPGGPARVRFAPPNKFGVLDHDVLTPTGETVHVPLRVLADGDGSEVVITLRRLPGTTDDELARDADLMRGDLARLRDVVEAEG
ncbi:SRPBCC family protein [Cellulomonas sp. 179-A 9B4 NHS]|uniref:SRPBCC family protein n=1 Tax=Cellulomonas sp. 179-A 9B4 NHS TaxID=3142379 RepID=UPI00399F1762